MSSIHGKSREHREERDANGLRRPHPNNLCCNHPPQCFKCMPSGYPGRTFGLTSRSPLPARVECRTGVISIYGGRSRIKPRKDVNLVPYQCQSYACRERVKRLESENWRRLWLFLGVSGVLPRNIPGKPQEYIREFFQNREV